jgi:hypothetical protein
VVLAKAAVESELATMRKLLLLTVIPKIVCIVAATALVVAGGSKADEPGYLVYTGERITHSREPKLSIRLGEPLAIQDLKRRFTGYIVRATFGEDCYYCANVTGRGGSFAIDYDASGVLIAGITSTDKTSVDALGNKVGAALRKIIGPSGNCDSGDFLTCKSLIPNLEYIVESEKCNIHVQEGLKTEIPACAKIAGFRIWNHAQ